MSALTTATAVPSFQQVQYQQLQQHSNCDIGDFTTTLVTPTPATVAQAALATASAAPFHL
jgi:hypothetical protein